MIVRIVVSAAVLLFLCAVTVVLARRLRDVPPTRVFVNLLFPLSQMCIAAFLFAYSIAYDLPAWMFVVVAVIGVACGPVDLALFKALRAAEERDLSRERLRLLEEQVQAQGDYVRRLSADIEEARRIRDVIATELDAVDDLLAREEAERASRGMTRVAGIMDPARKSCCAHPVVDALVAMKEGACEEAGIRMEVEIALADDAALPSVELCAVFSNLLDNAIDACRKVPEGERFIVLKAREKLGYLVVRMENSCVAVEGPKARPRKRGSGLSEHGWGLGILETLAKRRDGQLETCESDGVFTTSLVLKMGDKGAIPCAS